MLDLKKFKSKAHKVEFEEGNIFIKRLSTFDSHECDDIKDHQVKIVEMIKRSLCDEKGMLIEYSDNEIHAIDVDIAKTLVLEIIELNKAKKKLASVPEKSPGT